MDRTKHLLHLIFHILLLYTSPGPSGRRMVTRWNLNILWEPSGRDAVPKPCLADVAQIKLQRKLLIQLDTRENPLIRFSRHLTSIPSMRKHFLEFRSEWFWYKRLSRRRISHRALSNFLSFRFRYQPNMRTSSLPVHCVEWSKTEKSQWYEDINQRQAFDRDYSWKNNNIRMRSFKYGFEAKKGWNCVKKAAKPKYRFRLPHRSHRKQCVSVCRAA